jgi:hypothetical protein
MTTVISLPDHLHYIPQLLLRLMQQRYYPPDRLSNSPRQSNLTYITGKIESLNSTRINMFHNDLPDHHQFITEAKAKATTTTKNLMQIPHLPRTLNKSKSPQSPNRMSPKLPRCRARNERGPGRNHYYVPLLLLSTNYEPTCS